MPFWMSLRKLCGFKELVFFSASDQWSNYSNDLHNAVFDVTPSLYCENDWKDNFLCKKWILNSLLRFSNWVFAFKKIKLSGDQRQLWVSQQIFGQSTVHFHWYRKASNTTRRWSKFCSIDCWGKWISDHFTFDHHCFLDDSFFCCFDSCQDHWHARNSKSNHSNAENQQFNYFHYISDPTYGLHGYIWIHIRLGYRLRI